MVTRRLNKPVVKVGFYPVFWFNQVQRSEWNCRMCFGCFRGENTVAFEVMVRGTVARIPRPGEEIPPLAPPGIKLYLCMACAEKVLSEALDKVQRVKAMGPDAYQFMEAL